MCRRDFFVDCAGFLRNVHTVTDRLRAGQVVVARNHDKTLPIGYRNNFCRNICVFVRQNVSAPIPSLFQQWRVSCTTYCDSWQRSCWFLYGPTDSQGKCFLSRKSDLQQSAYRIALSLSYLPLSFNKLDSIYLRDFIMERKNTGEMETQLW